MPRIARVRKGSFIDVGTFEIPGIASGRRVRVYAPYGHRHASPRPTLYLFDGQNVFGNEGSFAGGWHVHEAIDRFAATRRALAPVVVAIDHGNERRIDELTAWSDGQKGGQADIFLHWLTGTLVPLLRGSIGLRPEPDATYVGGSSIGGLGAMYAHFKHPEVFGGALCMSPSFWFARRAIFGFVAAQPTPWRSRVYVDCGAKEGRGMMFNTAKRMTELLIERGYVADASPGTPRVMWRPDARGTHAERHWQRRFPKALRFIFR